MGVKVMNLEDTPPAALNPRVVEAQDGGETATVGGEPYALARKRSTFGRDALNLGALKDLTEGKATNPDRFWTAANQFGFTFNWAYTSRKKNAYFTSGRLPTPRTSWCTPAA